MTSSTSTFLTAVKNRPVDLDRGVPLVSQEFEHGLASHRRVEVACFDRKVAGVIGLAQNPEDRAVIAPARLARCESSVAVGQVNVRELACELAQVCERLVLDPRVIRIKQQSHIRLINLGKIRRGLRERRDDIGLALIQVLDGDGDAMSERDRRDHAEEANDLTSSFFRREAFGNSPRSARAKDNGPHSKPLCSSEHDGRVREDFRLINRRADDGDVTGQHHVGGGDRAGRNRRKGGLVEVRVVGLERGDDADFEV